jgi:hypothetical protein
VREGDDCGEAEGEDSGGGNPLGVELPLRMTSLLLLSLPSGKESVTVSVAAAVATAVVGFVDELVLFFGGFRTKVG